MRAMLIVALLCSACAPIYHPDAYGTPEESFDLAANSEQRDGVLILLGSRLRRPAEVVGIIDVHLGHTEYDDGLSELAARATELGADAVVGVEFHHGGARSPGHLSGLAVRVLR